MAAAVGRGCTYFDVAPTYFDWKAMTRLGVALKPYREQVFIASKTTERKASGAAAELAKILELLQTDHLDLFQLHAMNTEV